MKQRLPDPPPIPTNDLRVVAVGTALWAVALVVTAFVHRAWVPECAVGAGLGVLGMWVVRRRTSR